MRAIRHVLLAVLFLTGADSFGASVRADNAISFTPVSIAPQSGLVVDPRWQPVLQLAFQESAEDFRRRLGIKSPEPVAGSGKGNGEKARAPAGKAGDTEMTDECEKRSAFDRNMQITKSLLCDLEDRHPGLTKGSCQALKGKTTTPANDKAAVSPPAKVDDGASSDLVSAIRDEVIKSGLDRAAQTAVFKELQRESTRQSIQSSRKSGKKLGEIAKTVLSIAGAAAITSNAGSAADILLKWSPLAERIVALIETNVPFQSLPATKSGHPDRVSEALYYALALGFITDAPPKEQAEDGGSPSQDQPEDANTVPAAVLNQYFESEDFKKRINKAISESGVTDTLTEIQKRLDKIEEWKEDSMRDKRRGGSTERDHGVFTPHPAEMGPTKPVKPDGDKPDGGEGEPE